MNDPSALVGVSSSSAQLVSWSEGADSAAIHDASFFPCAILQRTWVSGSVHLASLTSTAFMHRITYLCLVLCAENQRSFSGEDEGKGRRDLR